LKGECHTPRTEPKKILTGIPPQITKQAHYKLIQSIADRHGREIMIQQADLMAHGFLYIYAGLFQTIFEIKRI
jgi:hypothetical protein